MAVVPERCYYDHLQGDRFLPHAAVFLRWRHDESPAACRSDQLDVTPPCGLACVSSG